MPDNFKIILEYIKDLSVETPDAETLIYVKDNILKYQMNIDITSQALKNKMIEVNTKLTFQDKDNSKKKSFFEIIYATIIKIDDKIKDKKEMEKIILCDLQVKIYSKLERIFLNLIKDSGYSEIKFDKKVDFEKLYNQRIN
tara:strand:- start:135 stop:557 length:423 start_codon:yes stop_codon:yes gene_type:complete